MPRTVVVTGGSSGIGLAAAVALARAGDEVVLLGRDRQRLARAVTEVRTAGGRTPAAYRADFAVLDEVRAAGAAIAAEHERIDVLRTTPACSPRSAAHFPFPVRAARN